MKINQEYPKYWGKLEVTGGERVVDKEGKTTRKEIKKDKIPLFDEGGRRNWIRECQKHDTRCNEEDFAQTERRKKPKEQMENEAV